MTSDYMNDDIVIACVDLVGRAGASGFEIGYVHDDVPVEEAGWCATATYLGARLTVDDKASPTEAALGLAQRLLSRASCRCGQLVSLSDSSGGCRWRLVGPRWEPGCDAEPVRIVGQRGDYVAMGRAMAERHGNGGRR
jgi:hypothetical protein